MVGAGLPRVRKPTYVSEVTRTTFTTQHPAVPFPFPVHFPFNVFLFRLAETWAQGTKAHGLQGNIEHDLELASSFQHTFPGPRRQICHPKQAGSLAPFFNASGAALPSCY